MVHSQQTRTIRMRPGRRRKLPVMTNSERGKYYRKRNKALDVQREARVNFLRRDVHRLEIQLQIARRLSQLSVPPNLSNISSFLSHFVTERHVANTSLLQLGRLEVSALSLMGPADAPVIRLEYMLRGHLPPQFVRRLYEFVVGNSLALEKMMYDEAKYTCTCFFYFSPDGTMEQFIVERDAVGTLRGFLGRLRVVGQALAKVQF